MLVMVDGVTKRLLLFVECLVMALQEHMPITIPNMDKSPQPPPWIILNVMAERKILVCVSIKNPHGAVLEMLLESYVGWLEKRLVLL